MKNKTGTYWVIQEGQETKGLYLGYAKPEPDGEYKYPLKTIESKEPANVKNRTTWQAVRYFSED